MSASAGRVLLMPKGDYNNATTYSVLDWVLYNGKPYVAKQTTTGNLPTNATYWQLLFDGASDFAGLADVDIDNQTLVNGQIPMYNATSGKWENRDAFGKVLSQSVTLSTSQDVTVTFTDATITSDSAIDVYTTDPDLTYMTMSISAGSCSITFEKQESASTITVRIYIK